MSEVTSFDETTLVMAHPDDEALWASSLLPRSQQIILCFEEVASQPAWGDGRRRSLSTFPLNGSISLGLQESEVFDGANWVNPTETEYGLAVRWHVRSMRNFSKVQYQKNYLSLVANLRPLLSNCRSVVTHSPWGEYGHEEHVQVFRAVATLQTEFGFSLWVPGYVSNKSYPLMLRCLDRLDPHCHSNNTNASLGAQLQSLYARNGCWTWFHDHVWPAREYFYRWLGPDEEATCLRSGRFVEFQMNFMWLDWTPPPTPLHSMFPYALKRSQHYLRRTARLALRNRRRAPS